MWDLITFPVRLVRLIPRYFENQTNTKAHHPLYKYLEQQGADVRILVSNHVWLEREYPRTGRFAEVFNFVERDQSEPPSSRWMWRGSPE